MMTRVIALILFSTLILFLACFTEESTGSKEVKKDIMEKISINPTKKSNKFYTLTDTSAGEFYRGAVIPLWKGAETAYDLKKNIAILQQEGESFKETQYHAYRDGEHQLTLIPHFDIRVQEYNEIVSEVIVLSSKYRNEHGIGIGSSVVDFKKAYPDAKCFFSYVSNSCWLSDGENGPQYMISTPEKISITSDLIHLPLEEIDELQKIQKIRIYQSGREIN